MAQYHHIRCVLKTDRTNAHERIQSVGGANPDGSRWILTQDKAVSCIQDGTHVFYIEKPGGLRLDVATTLRRSLIESNRTTFCLCHPVLRLRRDVSRHLEDY